MRYWIVLLASFFVITGCGYSAKSALPANLKKIHVEAFKNEINFAEENQRNIYFPLIEVKVRDAVINRFLFDGNLRISDAATADLILRGSLKNYNRTGLRFTENDDVQEYRVQITMALELFDTRRNEVLWSEPIVGEATYYVTGPSAKSESVAVVDATTDLARRIVEKTIENW